MNKEWRLAAIRRQIYQKKKQGRTAHHVVRVELRDDSLIDGIFLTDWVFRALQPEQYAQLLHCANCGLRHHAHVRNKCPYESTWFVPVDPAEQWAWRRAAQRHNEYMSELAGKDESNFR